VSIRTAEVAPRPPASLRKSHKSVEQSERIRRRRGLTLLAITLGLPGSAQLLAGTRRLGRLALRIWASLWFFAVLAVLLALILPEAALTMLTLSSILIAIKIVVITLGLGWVALIIDAWRLARPWEFQRPGRLGFSVFSLAMALTIFGGFIAVASMVSAQHDLTSTVFSGGGDQVVRHGRYNILLMGGDAGRDRGGVPA